MKNTTERQLLDFIAASPTAYHAVDSVKKELAAAGYTELKENSEWRISAPGKYFVCRNGSSLIAFRIPEPDFRGFMIMAAHSDSPSFKIKEKAEVSAAGMYTQLNVEKYGGMLCYTWLDRPLSAAGRIAVRENGKIVIKLVNIDRDLLMIPSVAIHMDRSANDGKAFNPNVDMLPLIGSSELRRSFDDIVAEAAGVKAEDIISKDLSLYVRTPGTVWGAEDEFISSPRLDDLQCVFGCMKGFLAAEGGKNAAVLCVFDNEEVGSGTKQGADSGFLEDTLYRVCEALGRSSGAYRAALASSFMVSADNAHAVHPNHPEYADRSDRPQMNRGIVIKYNANQRYTTDSVSAAVFTELCRKAEVPVQSFTNRADIAGGSTLGNISSSHVSVNTVDIGLPQLAMHSAYETAGVKDTEYLEKAAKLFFESVFNCTEEGIEI